MTILSLTEANDLIDRLRTRNDELEDENRQLRAELGEARTVPVSDARAVSDARTRIREAVEAFGVRMDGYEAEARALGIDLDAPIPYRPTEPVPQ